MKIPFSVGAVLAASLQAAIANFPAFLVIALLFHAPYILYAVFGPKDPLLLSLASIVDALIFNMLAAGAMTYGVVQNLRGQRAGIAACMSVGFESFGRVLGTGLLAGVRILVGLILLIVPGIMEICRLWVAVPAAVMEKTGADASIQRSMKLTEGRRWPVFGIVVVIGIVSVTATQVLFLAMNPLDALTQHLSLGIGTIVGIWSACASAVGYYQLRSSREGIDIEELSKVFE